MFMELKNMDSNDDEPSFERLESFLSNISITNTETLSVGNFIFEHEQSIIPIPNWLLSIKLTKIKIENELLQSFNSNSSRLMLLDEFVNGLFLFTVRTTLAHGKKIKKLDSLFSDLIKNDLKSFNTHLKEIDVDNITASYIKKSNTDILTRRYSHITDQRQYITTTSIADIRTRIRKMHRLDITETILAQNLIESFQQSYCTLNTTWADRYLSVYGLDKNRDKIFDVMKRIGITDYPTREKIKVISDNLNTFDPYVYLVNMKEVIINLCRELESWIVISNIGV